MSGLYRNIKLLVARHGKLLANHKPCPVLPVGPLASSQSRIAHPTNYYTTITNPKLFDDTGIARVSPFVGINLEQRRFKRKRPSKADQEDEEDDDDDELSNENPLLMDDLVNKADDGSEYMTISISSLRLDTFCKTAFAMTRAKVEESFYKGDIQINGELPNKKSMDINVGDEVDVVKCIDPEDNKLVNIKRAIILKMPDKASEHGRMKLDIQRWLNLSVESRTDRK